jgi:hypothetical protein
VTFAASTGKEWRDVCLEDRRIVRPTNLLSGDGTADRNSDNVYTGNDYGGNDSSGNDSSGIHCGIASCENRAGTVPAYATIGR